MLKTTASQRSWDELGKALGIPVVNTPVGFKELADSMINVEQKINKGGRDSITLKDVFGTIHNLGSNPRLLFAGEESGGEIFGPAEFITSKKGKKAISMREKSAGEAIIITAAMLSWLDAEHMTLADYLISIFKNYHIDFKYEIRVDQKYYNESEPDISILLKEKEKGMVAKTLHNSYCLSLALGYRDHLVTIEQVQAILGECFTDLNFSDLKDIKFCGDGTYILFKDKCLEVRPSGTDAVNKAYSFGKDQWECIKYAQAFAGYTGERTPLHVQLIPLDFYSRVEKYAFEIYSDYKENQ
jgi:phosphomannomutase